MKARTKIPIVRFPLANSALLTAFLFGRPYIEEHALVNLELQTALGNLFGVSEHAVVGQELQTVLGIRV